MKKNLASLALAVVLILSLSISALAATPRWGITTNCNVFLTFSGTTATCGVSIDGKTGTSKIVASVYLQKNNNGTYSTVRLWNDTVYGSEYILNESVPDCATGSYRLLVSATVYNSDGKSEPATNSTTGNC